MDTRQQPQGLLRVTAPAVSSVCLSRKGQEGDWTRQPAGQAPGRAGTPEERPPASSLAGAFPVHEGLATGPAVTPHRPGAEPPHPDVRVRALRGRRGWTGPREWVIANPPFSKVYLQRTQVVSCDVSLWILRFNSQLTLLTLVLSDKRAVIIHYLCTRRCFGFFPNRDTECQHRRGGRFRLLTRETLLSGHSSEHPTILPAPVCAFPLCLITSWAHLKNCRRGGAGRETGSTGQTSGVWTNWGERLVLNYCEFMRVPNYAYVYMCITHVYVCVYMYEERHPFEYL